MNTRRFLLTLVGSAGTLATLAAGPDETRLVANLLWGTNGAKPPDKELKPVDPALEKRLRRVFKWQLHHRSHHKLLVRVELLCLSN